MKKFVEKDVAENPLYHDTCLLYTSSPLMVLLPVDVPDWGISVVPAPGR